MPATPTVPEAVAAVRNAMPASGVARVGDREMARAIIRLFRDSDDIAGSADSIEVVLALAPELETLRGMGAKRAALRFAQSITHVIDYAAARVRHAGGDVASLLKKDGITESDREAVECLEKLAAHAFARVQGPPARAVQAIELRIAAWESLASACEVLRLPEHLAQALKVAADPHAGARERRAAVEFLGPFWAEDDADEATVDLLEMLLEEPPDRSFLMGVLQVRIDLGLEDELSALVTLEDWDEEQEE